MNNVSNLNPMIDLDTPIKRGETEIKQVSLRKPASGELRGTNLADLLQMDVTALEKVIPRISDPTLTTHEVQNLDPADLFQLGAAVSGFLLPKAMKPTVYQTE
ncbi:MAG: phage tail assembly protein [Methylotenera sp.]